MKQYCVVRINSNFIVALIYNKHESCKHENKVFLIYFRCGSDFRVAKIEL